MTHVLVETPVMIGVKLIILDANSVSFSLESLIWKKACWTVLVQQLHRRLVIQLPPSSPRIRILATIDPPYATDCLDVYPRDKECTHPGFEIEYIHTVISEMMGRAIQWIKVANYTIMDEYLAEGKGDILGISYTLDSGKLFQGVS